MLSIALLNEMAAIAAEVCAPADYEAELFRVLERAVGADVLFFKRIGGAGPVVRGLDAARFHAQERQLLDCRDELNEVLAVARRQSGVAVDRDVLGAHGLESKRYYQHLVKPNGGRYTAVLPVSWRGQDLSVLVLGRAGRYDARAFGCLQQLAPTLQLCEVSRQAQLLPPARAPLLASAGAAASGSLPARALLTVAEREVLSYLHLGYTNAEIARARGNNPLTVRNQLSSAYAKLGVASRAEAVAVLARLDGAS
jgi:DNA-binding CsgD family transcriptional regulator